MSMALKAVEDEPSHSAAAAFGLEVTPTISISEAVTPLDEEVVRGVPTRSLLGGLPDFSALSRLMEGNSISLHRGHISCIKSTIHWALSHSLPRSSFDVQVRLFWSISPKYQKAQHPWPFPTSLLR